MIKINQIKLPCGSDHGASSNSHPILERRIEKILKLKDDQDILYEITKHSVDARKKPDLYDIYNVNVRLNSTGLEKKIVSKLKDKNITYAEEIRYVFPQANEALPALSQRPIIVGEGPAGLFCALELAKAGYRPVILERGSCIEKRTKDVEHFWKTGELDPESNIQFGEGGAGTYSDGKLNSNVKDQAGRTNEVLYTFIEAGAHEDIAYEFRPHVGTDVLRTVIVNLRKEIEELGGEVHFDTRVTGLIIKNDTVAGVMTSKGDFESEAVVLAIGHSARDTIRALYSQSVAMEPKSFALGMRVSHPQSLIDNQQYGISDRDKMERLSLSAASYKLTAKASSGRGVYSFCMCPGGYVVNASSEQGRLAVNGMSNYARESERANSAIVITVDPEYCSQFSGKEQSDPLCGMVFQEQLEEKAFELSNGAIPIEYYSDYEKGKLSESDAGLGSEKLCIKGEARFAPLHTLLPEDLVRDFKEGMNRFDRTIPGFTGPEAIVMGLESRTSSPVRIQRDASYQANIKGLFPCGEGAGYAGGIMSAAIDGIKCAESISALYRPMED